MVCIAAFIILAVLVLSIPVLRIFNKKAADTIWKLFKKSTHCFTHRVTFRKCDSTFKDDVKNSILRKVVVKHPDWVKPLSIIIEVLSIAIICLTVWSLLVAFKSGVSLIAYDTCTPVKPEACVVGNAEACSAVSENESDNVFEWTINWFGEIGEAFQAIPPKFANWDVNNYLPENPEYYNKYDNDKPIAIDIFDPGCLWCKESFKNQLNNGFFDNYNVTMIPYALESNGEFQYANSDLIVRYLEAVKIVQNQNSKESTQWQIVKRIFTETNEHGVWQNDFNNYYDNSETKEILNKWLIEFGYSKSEVKKVIKLINSEEVSQNIEKNRDIVENQIKIVKIPTMLYDSKRHDGLYKP